MRHSARRNWRSRVRSFLGLLVWILAFAALSGCATMRDRIAMRFRDPMAGAPRMRNTNNPRLEDVVAHLNHNTSRIRSWRSNNVRILTGSLSLSGSLAVEKDRNVRLLVNSPMGTEVDLGSNGERFWVWSRRMEPPFVTCRHENMEAARQQLGIPFEPEWLMQALSVSPLPTTGVEMEVDPSHQQARLVQQVVTAHGQPLRRTVLVDLKYGVILEHSLYDYDGKRIALAKLSGHRMENGEGVVLPHRVLLEWPQNQMSMTMDMGRIQVNPDSIPSEIWDMPNRSDCPIVNLDAGLPPQRIAIRPDSAAHRDSGVRIDSIDTDESTEDGEASDEETELEESQHRPGRAALRDDVSAPSAEEEEWSR